MTKQQDGSPVVPVKGEKISSGEARRSLLPSVRIASKSTREQGALPLTARRSAVATRCRGGYSHHAQIQRHCCGRYPGFSNDLLNTAPLRQRRKLAHGTDAKDWLALNGVLVSKASRELWISGVAKGDGRTDAVWVSSARSRWCCCKAHPSMNVDDLGGRSSGFCRGDN